MNKSFFIFNPENKTTSKIKLKNGNLKLTPPPSYYWLIPWHISVGGSHSRHITTFGPGSSWRRRHCISRADRSPCPSSATQKPKILIVTLPCRKKSGLEIRRPDLCPRFLCSLWGLHLHRKTRSTNPENSLILKRVGFQDERPLFKIQVNSLGEKNNTVINNCPLPLAQMSLRAQPAHFLIGPRGCYKRPVI